MKTKCAKQKEVESLKAKFIRLYGEQQLIDDYNTAIRNRYVKQVH